jgi:hypothetical protein
METKQRLVIVGATSAIAEHCARLWVSDAAIDLTLVGRDLTRIQRVAADLRVRSPQSVIRVLEVGFLDPVEIQFAVDAIAAQGGIDMVMIAHGALPEQDRCQNDLAVCRDALEINGVSPVLFAEAFARHMAAAGRGTLALVGSVAGDRARRSNYVYGAAKGLVASYAEGLRHRFAGTAIRVILVKPGPTATPMTAHLQSRGARLASVERVAKIIVHAISNGQPVVYAPGQWKLIMQIIRSLPWFVFRKINI